MWVVTRKANNVLWMVKSEFEMRYIVALAPSLHWCLVDIISSLEAVSTWLGYLTIYLMFLFYKRSLSSCCHCLSCNYLVFHNMSFSIVQLCNNQLIYFVSNKAVYVDIVFFIYTVMSCVHNLNLYSTLRQLIWSKICMLSLDSFSQFQSSKIHFKLNNVYIQFDRLRSVHMDYIEPGWCHVLGIHDSG